ncbi:putative Mitochondrial tricarboxylate transporter [Taphrina deformans PYCC 5710]|uniref:Mitochondrial tricarboxylate transporter n=1 Tax=Taphrina deformans (strain PYCC 5710 / ATCC 11124 / CBS 356.35 / IMI 108563 / JCM 9778 / NBRC 8474) TaxID=1097556 RepID=R4X6R7_TAPDE|nr:putative Mitochondrial tricarboxylate transporter [Taphrina deformans PYCC 5710]|eukprot:CCG80892.1 putative Mitochondrial tricarboxylate transporter [Taphrina deformans PYCC 5710]
MTDVKHKPSPLNSVLSGALAGTIELGITYPFEYLKTIKQLNRRLPAGQKEPIPPFGKAWYTGCSTAITGNAIKAGVRFLAFDTIKGALAAPDGTLSGTRTVLAGFGAGVFESIFAVTPFEAVKTALIDDKKRAQPRLNGLFHGTQVILREQGFTALYKGLLPTMMRQSANSATRFASYNFLKSAAQGSLAPGEKLGLASTFAIGGMAGVITVYVTMPLDTVKTRMQSLASRTEYRNTFHCFFRIVSEEGVLSLWSGALPRLARLIVSGGVVFTCYEQSSLYLGKLGI